MNKIFWGLVIAHMDLYAGGIDVLPDALGYLLVAWGAWGIRADGRRFGGLTAVAVCMAALSAVLTGSGWRGALLLDSALTAAAEGMLWLAVRQAERACRAELNDALLLPASLLTALFAAAGVVLRAVENDIFAMLTTASTGLLTLWLFYAVWQIGRNYGDVCRQRRFDAGRT